MGYQRFDFSFLSDEKLRLAWELNLRDLGRAERRLGTRDDCWSAGRLLDAEMMKRWRARPAMLKNASRGAGRVRKGKRCPSIGR